MEVDHLGSDVNRDGVRALADFEAEAAVEREHGLGVLHRQRHVIEASDFSRLLRTNLDRTARRAGSHDRLHKRPAG